MTIFTIYITYLCLFKLKIENQLKTDSYSHSLHIKPVRLFIYFFIYLLIEHEFNVDKKQRQYCRITETLSVHHATSSLGLF